MSLITQVRDPARNAEIVKRLAAGETYGSAARAMGISRNVVAGVAHRAAHPFVPKGANHPSGENHYAAKLTWDRVRAIRARRATGEKLAAIAADFGVSIALVCKVTTGDRWVEAA